ncbi:MAG: DUF6516 family protein [Candidatus Heimdallarchaeota archaeon]
MIHEYLKQVEDLLKRIEIFVDYSFHYKLDEDAETLKIWISATFHGGARFNGFEFVTFEADSLAKDKYRYNFIVGKRIIRWDNAPHHPELATFPHHLHIDSKVTHAQTPSLEYILNYIKRFL